MSLTILVTDKQKQNLKEALGALDFSPECQKQWFEHEIEFCRKHGGEKHYQELLSYFSYCQVEATKKMAGK